MDKLAIFAIFLIMASVVPAIMGRMPQTFDNSNNVDNNIVMLTTEEIVLENTKETGTTTTTTTLGCANTGESCWNGVACCAGNTCSVGPYNSVCVEIVFPPPFPWY